MLRGKELKTLELRRQELVLQSTLNRLAISVELQKVQMALRPAELVVSSVRAARPWLVLLAPLAGIIAGRGLRNNGSLFSKMLGLIRCMPTLLALWNRFSQHSNGSTPGTPPVTSAAGPRV